MQKYWIYILCSKRHGTLYIGLTNNLARRIYEHKNHLIDGFTKKYKISTLVYAESYQNIDLAIQREKNLKYWKRDWKIKLIEQNNPEWKEIPLGL